MSFFLQNICAHLECGDIWVNIFSKQINILKFYFSVKEAYATETKSEILISFCGKFPDLL
jgi:hypothetical protein